MHILGMYGDLTVGVSCLDMIKWFNDHNKPILDMINENYCIYSKGILVNFGTKTAIVAMVTHKNRLFFIQVCALGQYLHFDTSHAWVSVNILKLSFKSFILYFY